MGIEERENKRVKKHGEGGETGREGRGRIKACVLSILFVFIFAL